ncbi:MAG: DUF1573 domain-containing protein [Candidatus Kapaibacteriales bacterium]
MHYLDTLYPNDEPYIYEYEISNIGDADLEIYKMKPECGCTVVELKDSILQPGEKTRVIVALETKRQNTGPNSANIEFLTNDPTMSDFNLVLNYDYKEMIRGTSLGMSFGAILPGEEGKVEYLLSSFTDIPLKVTDIEFTNFKIKRDLNVGDIIEPYSERKVTFTYSSNKLGNFSDIIYIHFDHPLADKIELELMGAVVETLPKSYETKRKN